MTLDYFYGAQADQFTFYRIPKALFTDERFRGVSAEAKILYGILLDRMSLSQRNGWLDEQSRVFIIFTLDEVMDAIGCADQKAAKLLSELENKAGLIERKRQGLGKPNLIYVKNFVDNSVGSSDEMQESRIRSRENHDSGTVKITNPESRKSQSNNTEINNTDLSETDTYPFPSAQNADHGRDSQDRMRQDMDEREQYRDLLEKNLEYDILLRNHPYEQDTIDSIKAIVREMDDDTAVITMVDSNLQREEISPMERAQAYKMKLEALKHQGKRPELQADSTSPQVGEKSSWAVSIVANDANASRTQIQRYIRLTELRPELQQMVDEGTISLTPAVELSYLSHDEQKNFLEAMDYSQNTPSLSRARRLKKLSREGKCSLEPMCEIMDEEKKNELDRITIKGDVLRKYFPRSYTPRQMQETIIKLLEAWQKKRTRQNER